jgi:microcin C transport system substrate-binding protein
MFERTFERVNAPFVRNLLRLGIDATMRIVDVANFENRMRDFDFDVTTRRYVQSLTPGIEQRNYWGSEFADRIGSLNLAGVKDPAIDALIENVVKAKTRDDLVTAARALDRVLMWSHYVVPHWYKGAHTIAFWDRFGWPGTKPKYARGVVDTWWVDTGKERRLAQARGKQDN